MKRDYASNIEWLTARSIFGFVSGGKADMPLRPITDVFKTQRQREQETPAVTQGEIRQGLISKLMSMVG